MQFRSIETQRLHNLLIEELALKLVESGTWEDIRASHINWRGKPAPVIGYGTHTPDITAHGTCFTIFEVETADTLEVAATRDELRAFADSAKETGGALWLVVPSNCISLARNQLSLWEIDAEVLGL